MKNNTYKLLTVAIISLAICIVLGIFTVILYNVLGEEEELPADATLTFDETSCPTVTTFESDAYTEAVSEEESTPDISETTEMIIHEEQKQEKLDLLSSQIISWLEEAIPTYKTEFETDIEGNVISQTVEYKPSVAFYYMDLDSGCTMQYNADRVFYTASIIKEPYILWALMEIERAEQNSDVAGTKFDVTSVFEYTEDKFKSGSGIIQNSEYGTLYSYHDLLRLSITHSDNVAFAELRNIYGRTGFNSFSEAIGVKSPQKKLYSANAQEMGAYLRETYQYFESGSKYANELKSWMLDTNHRIMIPMALKPTKVANKYGWDVGAYHDMGIVFDNAPYILVIMTELDCGTKDDNIFIRELAARIDSAHKTANQ